MDFITQHLAQIWVCGWAGGLLILRQATFRTWKQPKWSKAVIPLRGSFATPRGLFGIGVVTFILWGYLVTAITFSIWVDRFWEPDDEEEDSE